MHYTKNNHIILVSHALYIFFIKNTSFSYYFLFNYLLFNYKLFFINILVINVIKKILGINISFGPTPVAIVSWEYEYFLRLMLARKYKRILQCYQNISWRCWWVMMMMIEVWKSLEKKFYDKASSFLYYVDHNMESTNTL